MVHGILVLCNVYAVHTRLLIPRHICNGVSSGGVKICLKCSIQTHYHTGQEQVNTRKTSIFLVLPWQEPLAKTVTGAAAYDWREVCPSSRTSSGDGGDSSLRSIVYSVKCTVHATSHSDRTVIEEIT